MSRRLLIVVGLAAAVLWPATAHGLVVGTGGYPGVAVGAGGTAFVAYKVDTYGPADAVELCVLGARARSCAPRTRIGFPGEGYNSGQVGVHVQADGSILVVTGREISGDYAVWVARSTDGGRSFGSPVAVAEGFTGPTAIAPDGRLGLVSDAVSTTVGSPRLDGSDLGRDRPTLTTITPFASITTIPTGTVVASSDARDSAAWVLPNGADGFNGPAWQRLPPLGPGRQPSVSGGPAGLGMVIERDNRGLYFRRLDGATWARARSIGGSSTNDGFDLTQDGRGRLFAVWADNPVSARRTRIEAVRSNDRGATWSSIVKLGTLRDGVFGDPIQAAVGPDGRGVVVSFDDAAGGGTGNLGPVSVQRISPARVPVAQRRVGRAVVSLLAGRDRTCVKEDFAPVRLQASVNGNPVSVRRYVSGARFRARARRLRGGSRVSARYKLTRGPARLTARVKPRRGRSFTLRVRMRGCL